MKSEMPSDGSINGGDAADNRGDHDDMKRSSRKDNGGGGGGKDPKDICRDYLNNICNRGNRCKFYHPDDHEGKAQNAAEEPYQFCIDFQNQGCHRDNCRYVHAFREDVERYKRSGDVTLGLARALASLLRGDSINGIPICKEFQNGHCARGSQCRYWHINKDEERRKRFAGRSSGGGGGPPSPTGMRPAFGAYSGPPHAGIRRRADDYGGGGGYDDYGGPTKRAAYGPGPGMVPGMSPVPSTRAMVDLERRNAELVAEVDSLKRELQREKERYDDLMALFRATQVNQTAAIQQRPMQMGGVGVGGTGAGAAMPQPLGQVGLGGQQQQQPGMSGLGQLQQQQQQQPSMQQQWGAAMANNTGAGTGAGGYLGKYDWTSN